ncbi:MAG: peroxiredoxin [Candidatus Peribacteria bacterium]|jgi:peroxiredoxin (alkyl hydroperoxide reductase subunit C)|nr:peroxiredoxin [Candidatus Peribacteria bacterium]
MENTENTLHLESIVPNFGFDFYDVATDAVVNTTLADYKGKWVILFFYPADFTFVCPTELKDLMTIAPELKNLNAELFVVSTDTVFSHKRWVETEHLLQQFTLPMISDRKGEISKLFGVWNATTGNSERGTFIISPDGEIKSVEIVTEPIGRASNELLRKIHSLDFVRNNPGHACPASWNVGLKTLNPSIKIAGHVAESLEDK